MELPKFSMVSRELGNTVNALAIDGIFFSNGSDGNFRTAVTVLFSNLLIFSCVYGNVLQK